MARKGFDCSGVATKYNVKCSDGRTIASGAFKDQDGQKVPLCWNHDHDDPENTFGYAILHNDGDGMRADAYFDDSKRAQHVKKLLDMGTPLTYSINAGKLVQRGSEVLHGLIKEVSIVLAGANPGATIDSMHPALMHADGFWSDEDAIINFGDELTHSDESNEPDDSDETEDTNPADDEVNHADEEKDKKDPEKKEPEKKEEEPKDGGKTIQDVLDSMTKEQRDVCFALINDAANGKQASEVKHSDDEGSNDDEGEGPTIDDVLHSMTDEQRDVTYFLMDYARSNKNEKSEGGKEIMHTNAFETEAVTTKQPAELTHAQKLEILGYAEETGSFKKGLAKWMAENDDEELAHAMLDDNAHTYLLPEFQNVNGDKNRELWTDDMSWVNEVISGAHKVPFARVKTETIDARGLRAKGNKKGRQKTNIGDAKILHRETVPTMVYAKQEVKRQDILELKGNFDYVPFIHQMMQMALKYELAYDTLFGDGREEGEDKISEECIRPIWKDDELYVIHADIDTAAMAAQLQGTDTTTYFGEGFIESEAMIKVILDALIEYRGRGNMVAYMDPREVNKLLLARDRNGRRLYESKDALAKALNVRKIEEVQQIADLEPRVSGTGANAKEKELVAILVNMQDYAYGNVQGGEVTHFEDFDIDFNNYKYLDETFLSGAMRRIKSAIVIERDVTAASSGTEG